MYRHYIRINENYEVTYGYSSAFENPKVGDILLRETEQRHFYLGDFIFNPPLTEGISNKYLYVWEYGEVSKKQ